MRRRGAWRLPAALPFDFIRCRFDRIRKFTDWTPALQLDDAPHQLFSEDATAPGLQFALDPDNDEVVLGWQFEF